jgi:hypothetical protein
MSVDVTLIDEAGTVVGAGEQSLVWDPLADQYGRNWQVQGPGPHSIRVRIEPLSRVHSAQAVADWERGAVEVEFCGLNFTLQPSRRGHGSGVTMPDQH